jgi:hypothetical protein
MHLPTRVIGASACAAVMIGAGHAAAAVQYVAQSRLARSFFTDTGTIEQGSTALGLFDVNVVTPDTGVGGGSSRQTSFLGTDVLHCSSSMSGSGHNGRGGAGYSEVHATFDVITPTNYSFDILFRPVLMSNGHDLAFSLRLSGPGVLHQYTIAPGTGMPVPTLDLRGVNALGGTMGTGRYILDVVSHASGGGGSFSGGAAEFSFYLAVPGPGTISLLGAGMLLAARRRR